MGADDAWLCVSFLSHSLLYTFLSLPCQPSLMWLQFNRPAFSLANYLWAAATLGLKVWVSGLGFKVWGSRYGAQGMVLKVWSSFQLILQFYLAI